jgi:hypothetical protein
MTLSSAFSRLELSCDESTQFFELLKASVAAFDLSKPLTQEGQDLFKELSDAILMRSPLYDFVPPSGYLWLGSIANLLPDLKSDAFNNRPKALRGSRHLMLEKPPTAQQFLKDPTFASFLKEVLPSNLKCEPTSSYYHYYESPSDRVEPHIDSKDFALSCLTLIEHEFGSEQHSHFYICPPKMGPVRIPLSVGDAIVFCSGSVVHARTAPGSNERVVTASWGFKALKGLCD